MWSVFNLSLRQALCKPNSSLSRLQDGSTAFKIAWQAGHRDVGLLLYVHEQMLRSKLPNRGEPIRKSLPLPARPKPPK